MEDGRILKEIFYGQLASGIGPKGRPQLRYKDVCKRNMKALDINIEIWEDTAANRSSWRCLLKKFDIDRRRPTTIPQLLMLNDQVIQC